VERVVLDPAVLVSALITPHGNPAQLWQAVVDQRLEITTCPRLLAELAGVLERPKFRRYTTADEARAFVAEVARRSLRVPDPQDVPPVSRDPNDDYLFALAQATDATTVVSGDQDVTDLQDPPVPVLTPAQAVETLLSGGLSR
jgi:putative PIN family toxin of toxin-antitoxin system